MTTKVSRGNRRSLEEALAYVERSADECTYLAHRFPAQRRSIPRRAGKRMPPVHPGDFLRKDFLNPLQMAARTPAQEIKVPERQVVAIVKEGRSLDAAFCLRLARFSRMTPEFWMNMQKDYELERARKIGR